MLRLIGWSAAGVALLSAAAGAHHSISAVYDSSRQVRVDGVVAQFQLVNPHPFLLLDVRDGAGPPLQWRLEMDNLRELADIGVTAATFKPGDRLVVNGSQGRTQPQSLYVLRLDRPADGFWYEQVGTTPRIGRPAR